MHPFYSSSFRIFLILFSVFFWLSACGQKSSKIDREALVKRHIPVMSAPDSLTPFTVGNGNFAFTAGITGLQTFTDYYEEFIPLGTLAHWGWHSVPNPENYTFEQTLTDYDTYGRPVSYGYQQHSEAGAWLRANPHRLHLGNIGFYMVDQEGDEVPMNELAVIRQEMNIWDGIIHSSFKVSGREVKVQSAVHPQKDQIAADIQSALLGKDQLHVDFKFPYGSQSWGKQTADWNHPEAHQSEILLASSQSAVIHRKVDTTTYYVIIEWEGEAELAEIDRHHFRLNILEEKAFSYTAHFTEDEPGFAAYSVADVFNKSKANWNQFWQTGGTIDLSESSDPRAHELERRIVLSRYLTAVQTSGNLPPAETGLTYNSWFGKFHLEMHWWHGVHYVLWNKPEMFERSLGWYASILEETREKATRQGYEGVRWPKMTDYRGKESPSTIGVFLIWQQPHPIYYAELLYRYHGEEQILEEYQKMVFETAEFMASYAHFDAEENRYLLGPPLIPAQERYDPEETVNPTFELAYWKYGLETAQKWRERLGMERNEKWQHVIDHLSPLPANNGYYQNAEHAMHTFEDERHRTDHPTVAGFYGMIPHTGADKEKVRRTLKKVMESWDWGDTWGWDYPMTAMTAARVGEPEIAVEALLMDVQKNRYLPNGHNYQDENLTIYLPGNGGLLTATAMMAAGWDGAPDIHAPGFPQDGTWVVKYEEIYPLP